MTSLKIDQRTGLCMCGRCAADRENQSQETLWSHKPDWSKRDESEHATAVLVTIIAMGGIFSILFIIILGAFGYLQ